MFLWWWITALREYLQQAVEIIINLIDWLIDWLNHCKVCNYSLNVTVVLCGCCCGPDFLFSHWNNCYHLDIENNTCLLICTWPQFAQAFSTCWCFLKLQCTGLSWPLCHDSLKLHLYTIKCFCCMGSRRKHNCCLNYVHWQHFLKSTKGHILNTQQL